MKNFNGQVLFLDRNDINTDEIIPAKYLTEITKRALQPYLLEDLEIKGFSPEKDLPGKSVIVSRTNFGCGSSREHAPWALEVNGINLVIAENFARIFEQNMFNCGMMAIRLPSKTIDHLFEKYSGEKTFIDIDLEKSILKIRTEDLKEEIEFSISEFNKTLVKANGWLEYADSKY